MVFTDSTLQFRLVFLFGYEPSRHGKRPKLFFGKLILPRQQAYHATTLLNPLELTCKKKEIVFQTTRQHEYIFLNIVIRGNKGILYIIDMESGNIEMHIVRMIDHKYTLHIRGFGVAHTPCSSRPHKCSE